MVHPVIHLHLLGDFIVTVDDVVIPYHRWRHTRAVQFVQLLALAPGHRLRREQVIDTLWPDLAPDAGAANLRKAAHLARQVCGFADAIVLSGGDAHLAPHADLTTDAEAFERAAAAARASGAAAASAAAARLYTGAVLPAAVYEPWADEARIRLHRLYLDLLRASELWEQLALEEPTDEAAHRALMRRELALGNRASALRWYARLESALRDTLGVGPDAEMQQLRRDCRSALPVAAHGFVGRRDELALVERWLALDPQTRSGGLVISGHAGIGKTTLGRQLGQLASRLGQRVVTVTAHDSPSPYGTAIALVQRLLLEQRTVLDRMPQAHRTILAQLTPLAEPAPAPQGPTGRHQIFGAVRRLLLAATEGGPIILHIDDAHLLGPSDADLVLDLAVTGRPAFVVLALRPHLPDAAFEQRVGRMVHSGHLSAIRLGPLSDEETRTMIAASNDALGAEQTSRIVSAAQGNPFVALELAQVAHTTADAVPESARDAILARLCDVPPDARRLLHRLALAGDEFDAALVVGLEDEDEATTFRRLDDLLSLGVLVVSRSSYRFRHELVRQSLADALAPHQRLEAHRAIAACLALAGASPARVAQHWLAGGRADAAVPFLVEAAERALRVGAFADALGCLEPVLAATPHHGRALRLRAEALDGRGERAAVQAYRDAADVADPRDADDLRAKGALAQIKLGDPAGALEALAPLEPTSTDGRLAEALAYCGAAAMGVSAPERGAVRAAAARRLALDAGDTASLVVASWAHAAVAHARGELPSSVWADLYDTRHVPHLAVRVFDGQLCITQRLLYGSRPYADVIAFASALAAEAARLGAARGQAFGVTLRGEAHLLSGNLDAAEADLRLGVRLHRDLGGATGESFSLQRLAEVSMYRGERARAVRLLDEALDVARQTDIGFHLLDRIYGTRIAIEADPEQALAALMEAEEKVCGPLETCPGCRITLEVPAAIAAARAGDIARAEQHAIAAEYLASVVMQLPAWHAAVDEVHGHLSRARGEQRRSTAAHFARAAVGFRSAGQPLDAARCDTLIAGA